MKREYSRYYCDICGKEVSQEIELKRIIIPIRHVESTDYQGFGKYSDMPRLKQFDVCNECLEGIQKAISKEFANIYSQDYASGITVEFVEKKPALGVERNEK